MGRNSVCFVMGFACWCATAAVAAAPSDAAPQIVGTFPENEADIVRLPDDELKIFYNERSKHVGSISSRDGGRTWSEPRVEFVTEGETAHAVQVLLDRRGELHVFYLIITRGGRKLGVDLFLDLWSATTTDARRRWQPPRKVFHGAVGALRGIVQMKSGRIVVPFSTAHPERKAGLPTGNFYTTAIYSDDDGATWQTSASQLTAPCTDGYNGGNYGAVEPTVVELRDGRLWMLIRTQTGRMYESFSVDGSEWSPAAPSQFYGSNSPALLRRLDDGRLLLLWNNAQIGPRFEGQGVYGGRDALHAALSDDDGRTWRGFRELYRDPTRNGTSDVRNDRGTAYPDAVQARDGTLIVVTGQAADRRAILRFEPQWLSETKEVEDFSAGAAAWHVQQDIGPAVRFYRARRVGAETTAHPDDSSRQVLRVARRDAESGAGAVWNFPSGRSGKLTLRVRNADDFGGATISLADRLFHPCADAAARDALFSFEISRKSLPMPNTWHDVTLAWNVDEKTCTLAVDGNEIARRRRADLPATFGISYLNLRSIAATVDAHGLTIERVAVEVDP